MRDTVAQSLSVVWRWLCSGWFYDATLQPDRLYALFMITSCPPSRPRLILPLEHRGASFFYLVTRTRVRSRIRRERSRTILVGARPVEQCDGFN